MIGSPYTTPVHWKAHWVVCVSVCVCVCVCVHAYGVNIVMGLNVVGLYFAALFSFHLASTVEHCNYRIVWNVQGLKLGNLMSSFKLIYFNSSPIFPPLITQLAAAVAECPVSYGIVQASEEDQTWGQV